MILTQWVSFTPVTKASDQLFRRYSEFRGLSSVTCRLRSGSSVGCSCLKSKPPHDTTELENGEEEGFSVLASDIPWEENAIWSTFALYMFCLHIPLSFGGLSIVANILHQKLLDPQTQVLSLVVLQMVELSGTVFLLRNTAKPQCKSINFLKGNNDSRQGRNWVVGSALGLGCLVGFIFITSLVADQLFGSKVSLTHRLFSANIILSFSIYNLAEANMCLGSGQLGVGEDNGERGCIEKRVFCSLLRCSSHHRGDCVQTLSTDIFSVENGMEEGASDQLRSICSIALLRRRVGAAVWDRVRSRGMLQLVRELSLVGGRSLLVQCLDTPPYVALLSQTSFPCSEMT
ncbi:unnamed protein product [Arabis nemorensis]|uniref:Uncharacterized protein n=1 Tax=Arabis nemorensis TaxID=586526 RepID=A0A565BGH4_9BRAS|nr:unnamed protein product [Arabis nemorensis]